MKCAVVFFAFLLLAGFAIPAQAQGKKEEEARSASGKENPPKSKLEYSLDTITNRLDDLHLTLNRINDFTSLGFNTKGVEQELPELGSNIQSISENLSLSGSVPDFKSLQLYTVLLGNIKDQLQGWRSSLFKYNIDLINMNHEIDAFTHDSVIHQLIRDNAYRKMYIDEITELEAKWRQADTATHSHLDRITRLQSAISQYYFRTIDLQNQVLVLRNQLS